MTGCSHHRVIDAAGWLKNPDLDLEIINHTLNLFNNVRNIQRDRLGYLKNRLHTSGICVCADGLLVIYWVFSASLSCHKHSCVCHTHLKETAEKSNFQCTKDQARKEDTDNLQTHSSLRQNLQLFLSCLVSYIFTVQSGHWHHWDGCCWRLRPCCRIKPTNAFYLSFHCSWRKENRKNIEANGWLAKRNWKIAGWFHRKISWTSLCAH